MPVAVGTRLGSYEITGLLGAGGMGEVYRANDPKLGRDVAIKVLPETVAQDADRLERFQREAKVLASLSHPNIGAIYDLHAEGDTQFLVLELVEGETLATRLRRGPLSLTEALDIAKQIAAALEAAHHKHVLHRDLKPSNVQLTSEGLVKVLDFGLAKVMAPETTGPSASATIVSPAQTRIGVILGTAAYMSPEQARGHELDERTDLWSFGCVLYECLTGQQAFEGDDVTETVAAILKSEPDWSVLPPATPAVIRSLLRQCLRKQRAQRLRDAGAARLTIEDALVSPPEVAAVASAASLTHRWRWGALIGAAVLVGGVVLGRWFVPSSHAGRAARDARIDRCAPGGRTLGFAASGLARVCALARWPHASFRWIDQRQGAALQAPARGRRRRGLEWHGRRDLAVLLARRSMGRILVPCGRKI